MMKNWAMVTEQSKVAKARYTTSLMKARHEIAMNTYYMYLQGVLTMLENNLLFLSAHINSALFSTLAHTFFSTLVLLQSSFFCTPSSAHWFFSTKAASSRHQAAPKQFILQSINPSAHAGMNAYRVLQCWMP